MVVCESKDKLDCLQKTDQQEAVSVPVSVQTLQPIESLSCLGKKNGSIVQYCSIDGNFL